jgi:hypothetical protein
LPVPNFDEQESAQLVPNLFGTPALQAAFRLIDSFGKYVAEYCYGELAQLVPNLFGTPALQAAFRLIDSFGKYVAEYCYGELAQLARAPALQAGGHRFDSDILHLQTFFDMLCTFQRIPKRGYSNALDRRGK